MIVSIWWLETQSSITSIWCARCARSEGSWPGGRGVFLEPLAHNPLLRIGRRLTPAARTPDEHPFTAGDWRLCAEMFPAFSHRELELTSVPLLPLVWPLPRAWHRPLAQRIRSRDDRLLERHPSLRPLARTTLLVLE